LAAQIAGGKALPHEVVDQMQSVLTVCHYSSRN
jgi:hypothetical protein